MSRSIPDSVRRWTRAAACRGAARLAATVLYAGASSAYAHGFGQRYDLPLPLSLYLVGTAAAIVFSFVIVGAFIRRDSRVQGYPYLGLPLHPPLRIAWRGTAFLLRVAALVLFGVTVLAGFVGNQDPYRNIAPTLVWIISWVGLVYVSAFVGNVWAVINPWRTVFASGARMVEWASPRRQLVSRFRYPPRLGVWPAFFLLLGFSWIELVYPSPALPSHIAWMIAGYSILTWAGMTLFGRETWLRHGEVFSVVFGLFARFAPTEVRIRDGAICARCDAACRNENDECIDCRACIDRASPWQCELALRPFGAGLLARQPAAGSMTALVLLILSCVLYDGILGTPEWNAFENALAALMPIRAEVAVLVIRTLGVAASWLLFFGAYVGVCTIIAAIAPGSRSGWEFARIFAFTLVPIAIAYHVAHYLGYLLVQGQYIVPLLSDPFGFGWNLIGTAGYRVDIGLVGARFAWYAAVIAIVAGHIVAVYLAHVRAVGVFATRRAAVRSEVPLTALMVVYTFVSLSILAEPITERRVPARPAGAGPVAIQVPDDAVLPMPGDGRLQPVGGGKIAKQKLTYRVLGSAFQDGTPMTAADIQYAYVFAYRWGVRNPAEPSHYDPFVDAATAPMREHLLAVKFTGIDSTSKSFRVAEVNVVRELLIFDVYTDIASGDAEQDAVLAPPWTTIPWDLLALMEEAVTRGWAAFSEGEAKRLGVEWIDLVRSDRVNKQLLSLVETFERDGYRPAELRSLVSTDEARKRWAALAAFYREHGHFLVTNGPYVLKAWTNQSMDLDVFRDLSYPLGVGSFDVYAVPRRGFVTKVERTGNRLQFFADIETVMKFQRSYDIVRKPLQSIDPEERKRAAPECRYTIVDTSGHVALAGAANFADDASFDLDLGGKLPAGSYTLLVEIVVNGNAMNAEVRRVPVAINP